MSNFEQPPAGRDLAAPGDSADLGGTESWESLERRVGQIVSARVLRAAAFGWWPYADSNEAEQRLDQMATRFDDDLNADMEQDAQRFYATLAANPGLAETFGLLVTASKLPPRPVARPSPELLTRLFTPPGQAQPTINPLAALQARLQRQLVQARQRLGGARASAVSVLAALASGLGDLPTEQALQACYELLRDFGSPGPALMPANTGRPYLDRDRRADDEAGPTEQAPPELFSGADHHQDSSLDLASFISARPTPDRRWTLQIDLQQLDLRGPYRGPVRVEALLRGTPSPGTFRNPGLWELAEPLEGSEMAELIVTIAAVPAS